MYSLHCDNHIYLYSLFHAMPYDDVPLRHVAVMLLWEASVEHLCFELGKCSQSIFLNLWCHQILSPSVPAWVLKKKVLWGTMGLCEVFLEGFYTHIDPVSRHGMISSAVCHVFRFFHCFGMIQASFHFINEVMDSHTSAFMNNSLNLCHIFISFACGSMTWMPHLVV